MSLAHKAARGALWTVISSMGGRAVGVIGTLVITRFLVPSDIGEVSDAAILSLTASWITIWGFGQYTVVKGRGAAKAEVTWHATFFYFVLGIVSLGIVVLFGGPLTRLLDAPNAAKFVPGMALSVFIRRMGAMPERILTQQMNFRPSSLAMALGEFAFTATALPLAALGWGGWSMVAGNIVKSIIQVWILVAAAGLASWATPTKLSLARTKDMLKFGVPLGIQGVAHMASRYWDNLAISYWFGTAPLGAYNMAYNLADIPAVQVGEQIALVLLPSMAELPVERRARALERSTALLSLVIFPLAIGLGLVAYPLIAWILPKNGWQEVAPLLTVLACLSVFRPITWVLSAYMEAEQKTGRLMFLELAKVAFLIIGIGALSPFGLRVSAGAVGLAFGLTALAGVAMVVREGPSPTRLAIAFLQPFAACAVMASVVWLVHKALIGGGVHHPSVLVLVEVVAGAIAYVGAALVICRETSRDLLQLLGKALGR
ncbi:MAG TPA: oligosaccharide flippase family protein [Kofleriaceae bacterium]|nr:oligosaccharide flippase family protein [Kofleriaceae bacterium]